MNKNFIDYQFTFLDTGKNALIENVKILLYKKDSQIFEKINFYNDNIYQEPLLFSFFNDTNKGDINSILYGYWDDYCNEKVSVLSNDLGKIYLPTIGWLETKRPNQLFDMVFNKKDDKIAISIDNNKINYKFEPLEIIANTDIELIKYQIQILDQFYYDVDNNNIKVEVEKISKKHLNHLSLAFQLIQKFIPNHFELISLVTKKVVIFNVDTTLRNSFATLSAQGVAFCNAYQEGYNEVFFIDDIAHQTGHLIFNAILYDLPKFIKVDPKLVVETLHLENGKVETRDLHVLFHALYTYHTSLTCLDAIVSAKILNEEKTHEALGRINFYIGKCYQDLILIDKPISSSVRANRFFTKDGLILLNGIKDTFNLMVTKWGGMVKRFDMSNQPYNFTYSKFLELNPLGKSVFRK